ncbi:MAG: glycogen/starch/alpha-glucan phosphorylase, partial [Cyanobacteria bacterium J06633_2]
GYRPRDYYAANPELKDVIDSIAGGAFSNGDKQLFRPLIESLMNQDMYLLFADYASYIETQDKVAEAYRNYDHWVRMSILNSARMGKFSSDRSIRDYRNDIWQLNPVTIQLNDQCPTGEACLV